MINPYSLDKQSGLALDTVLSPDRKGGLLQRVSPNAFKPKKETLNVDPNELHGKMKVFINGCWVGITNEPKEFYNNIHEKKCKGIINIYTSIIFDYYSKEIRVCNDAGRMFRPLLRVNENNLIINDDIVNDIENNKLNWDDLLVSCNIDDSVVEYIDAEEQDT